MTILLDNVDVDTITPVNDAFISRGGAAVVFVRADDYGGGRTRVLSKPPNDPRYAVMNNSTQTQDGEYQTDYLPVGTRIRGELFDSTGASNVHVEIDQ